jgi:hypothetical protein
MKQCSKCGYTGKPELEQAWLAVAALLVWLIPLGFLSFGYWPFFLLPAIATTAWAVTAVRLRCPACKQRWKSVDSRVDGH